MGRDNHPKALTLERFTSGKNGQTNAFKKRKQVNKRKLFRKAQLKRQYAKVLKREGFEESASSDDNDKAPSPEDAIGGKHRRKLHILPARVEMQRALKVMDAEREEEGQDHKTRPTCNSKRQVHRPDPFRGAKVQAEQRRQEIENKQREQEKQRVEKEKRAKQRRKQHALLSKRTKGGQPLMKNTMRHLLEKIKAQT